MSRGRAHASSHPIFQLSTLVSKLELTSYKRVAVRKLVVARTPEMMQALKRFIHETRDIPYTTSMTEMLKVRVRGGLLAIAHGLNGTGFQSGGTGRFGINEYNPVSMHCTGLVAELYIRWGLLTNKISSNNYSPYDFEVTESSAFFLLTC